MALVVDVSWGAVTELDNGDTIATAVTYDFRDSEGNSRSDLATNSVSSIPVPDVEYGDFYDAYVTAMASGYPSSLEGSGRIRRNDAPSISADPTVVMQSVSRNPASVSFSIVATDDDPDASTMSFSISDRRGSGWTLSDDGVVDNKATATVKFARPTGGWGSAGTRYRTTVTVTDRYGLRASVEVEIRIVNLAPEISSNERFSVAQGESITVDLSDYVTDEENDPITYALVSGLAPATGSITVSSTGTMRISVNSAASTGSYPFTISATAGGDTVRSSGWRVIVTRSRIETPSGFSFGFRNT